MTYFSFNDLVTRFDAGVEIGVDTGLIGAITLALGGL